MPSFLLFSLDSLRIGLDLFRKNTEVGMTALDKRTRLIRKELAKKLVAAIAVGQNNQCLHNTVLSYCSKVFAN